MANPFRNKTMRAHYESATKGFHMKHRTLFLSTGERRRTGNYGSSFATYFWHGYDGVVRGIGWDAASRATIAYALWCAGRDVRKAEEHDAELQQALKNMRVLGGG